MVNEKTDKQMKALQMHLLGRKLVDISNALNIPIPTLDRWKREFKWNIDMEKAKKKTEVDMEETMITIRGGILKASSHIFMEGYKTYIEDLQIGKPLNLKPTELVQLGNLIESMTRPRVLIQENAGDVISVNKLLEVVNDARRGDRIPKESKLPDKKQESKATD